MVGVVLLELSIFSVLQMSALTEMEIKGVHNFYATYMYINCTNLSFWILVSVSSIATVKW